MSKILSIKETTFKRNDWSDYEGYEIITEDNIFRLGISNLQDCCEEWGYITSEDSFDESIGASLISIDRTDKELKKYEDIQYLDEGNAMFIDLNTSKGKLQFVVYNCHNGYYSHDAVFMEKDEVKYTESL